MLIRRSRRCATQKRILYQQGVLLLKCREHFKAVRFFIWGEKQMKFDEPNKDIITVPRCEKCFVYFLIDNGEVVYVGQTKHGLARPLQHREKEYDEIKMLYCDSRNLDVLEDTYIRKYKPKYNKQLNYAVSWGLLRVRNNLRSRYNSPSLTVPRIKKFLSKIGIEPIKDEYTGCYCITFDEYLKVIEEIENRLTEAGKRNDGQRKRF